MAKVVFYDSVLDDLLNSPRGEVGRYLKGLGDDIIDLAQKQVGVRTSKLKNSIAHKRHFKDSRGQQMWIGSSVRYALVHHEGRGPQIIVPRSAKVLRFVSKGQIIFANKVVQKSVEANKYLSDPLYKVIK